MTLKEMETKCDKCKSYRKFDNLNMCIGVDECRHDDFKYFTEIREPRNPSDCKVTLMEGCILESRKDDESTIDVCNRCVNFNKGIR